MQKFLASVITSAFAFSQISVLSVFASGVASVSLTPSNASVKTGESVSLSINVNPMNSPLDTVRVDLSFDVSKLEVLDFTLGNQFPSLSPVNSYDNKSGTFSYGAYKIGTAVSSNGLMGVVKLRALSSGSAKVSVLPSTRLIADGVEQFNGVVSSSTIAISGSSVGAKNPSVEEKKVEEVKKVETPVVAPKAPVTTGSPASSNASSVADEKVALAMFKKVLNAEATKSEDDQKALKCLLGGGCKAKVRDLKAEKSAIAQFVKLYKKNPKTSQDWNLVDVLAYTKLLNAKERRAKMEMVAKAEKEKKALEAKKLADDKKKTEADKKATELKAKADEKKVADEAKAKSEADKKAAELKAKSEAEKKKVVEVKKEEVKKVEPAKKVLSAKEVAIGKFGKLKGYLPGVKKATSNVDWKAVDMMVSGFKPTSRNLDKEEMAIKKFTKVFGSAPKSTEDWNIVTAIAYSGAF